MRAQSFFRYVAGATPVITSAVVGVSALAAPPAPCSGAAQITDASGDGHHPSSDVLAAWFSEASGHLQAVIKVRAGTWVAEHDDADVEGSGYALVFAVGGRTAYVRVNTPGPDHPTDPVTYDYGTYTSPGGFASAGATTGTVEVATGGTATVDVPAATGAVAGAKLSNPFVVTYDGISGGVPDWVDHAPGGTDPGEASYGADYVVGSCGGETTPPGETPGPGTTPSTAVTALQLDAPARVKGRRTVTIRGQVLPARAGVSVALTRTAHSTVVSHLTSGADGTFSARIAIGETTRLRAAAEGIGSRELTVTAATKVKIKVRRDGGGSAVVTGQVDPKLPGRVLWLRSNAVTPSAKTTTRNGTFRLRLKHPRPGRYQAVVIPTGNRAERATSNTGVIR